MPNIRKIFLLVLKGIFLLLLLFTVTKLIQTNKSVSHLRAVDDVRTFVVNFDESTASPVEVIVDSQVFPPDLFGYITRSSFFPYSKLDTKAIATYRGCTGVDRFILIDKWWKVFWITISRCGPSPKNYGPFRMSDPAAVRYL